MRVMTGGGTTTTITLAVAVPPKPTVVIVYAVVDAGVISTDPLTGTTPTPWSISHVSAFVVFHVNVEDWPAGILTGDAVSVTVGGGTTIKVTLAVVVPPKPTAVIMYVVVTAGVTTKEPVTGTEPTPWSISHVSAVVVLHVNVADWPKGTLSGDTVNVTVGGGTTVKVTLAIAVPLSPTAVSV